ncbi:hypothetical protein GALMADRAFT_148062 [Galerina marginata CBS 339.88]|uniref:Uncharacterized protein n=1 Tax=Galerina marginata (strain CBS 339.88) TaxID=685588 RepID=A0A067S892_GALM3|nr:hypothetical protein GALMADRAFT_148062 [Galerina marginata CBS 339.88]
MADSQCNIELAAENRVGGESESSTVESVIASPTIGSVQNVGSNDGPDDAISPASRSDETSTSTTTTVGFQNVGGGGEGVVFDAAENCIYIYGGTFVNCQFHSEEVNIEGGSFYLFDHESGNLLSSNAPKYARRLSSLFRVQTCLLYTPRTDRLAIHSGKRIATESIGWSQGRQISSPIGMKKNSVVVLNGTDALVIAELPNLRYRVLGLNVDEDRGVLETGYRCPVTYFVTSANMNYIPDFACDPTTVRVRVDGRFGTHDLTLWPQWYFEGTRYLPYVLKKPPQDKLANHEYHLAWYDLTPSDFELEPGSISDIGMISLELRRGIHDLRSTLYEKIREYLKDKCLSENNAEVRDLLHCNLQQRYACITLESCPQTYLNTLITFTSFQRHFLEAIACLDYFTKWQDIELRASCGVDLPLNTDIIGCVTPDLILAQKFFDMGVPYWLVRPISTYSKYLHIVNPVQRTKPDFELRICEEIGVVWEGAPSALRNRACQTLRIGLIRIGHSAKDPQPGEVEYPSKSASSSSHGSSSHAEARPPYPLTSPAVDKASSPSLSRSSSALSLPHFGAPYVPRYRAKTGRQINADKFKEPLSPNCPEASSFWAFGLKSVQPDWHLIWDHRNQSLLRGYPLLDPAVLTTSSTRTDVYFLSWLLFRSTCLSRTLDPGARLHTATTRRGMPKPGPQEWREFLWQLGKAFSLREDDGHQRAAKKAKIVEDVATTFDFPIPGSSVLMSVFWNGSKVKSSSAIQARGLTLDQRIRQQVVWDLYEHNFRLELLALDCCIFPRDLMPDSAAGLRDEMVLAVFPDHRVINILLPSRDEGLGARSWRARGPYVEAFRGLLSWWSGEDAAGYILIFALFS